MAAGLADVAGPAYALALLAGFTVVALWETAAPMRPSSQPTGRRWAVNFALYLIGQAAARLLLPLAAITLAAQVHGRGLGLLPWLGVPTWPALLLGVLALDLGRWALHAAQHHVPWLWRLHRVHHSDLEFDCTLGLRFHPLEGLLSAGVILVLVAGLGVSPWAVLLSDTLTIALGFFAHGNVTLSPAWRARLSPWLVTPDFHRVHHSVRRAESQANFGSLFTFWDRLAGTARDAPADGQLGMSIGLHDCRDPHRLGLVALLLMPFTRRRPGAAQPTEGGPAR